MAFESPAPGREVEMYMIGVHIGDELIIDGHRVGEPARRGQVLEVRGEEGGPPYRVRWDDSGRETLLYPGPDCRVKHLVDDLENDAHSAGAVS